MTIIKFNKNQMDKKNTTIINIAEAIAPIISSRDIIKKFKKKIERAQTLDFALDFSNVQFISRSAAHQLLIIKEELANRTPLKIISFINTNDDATKMLRLVAASRALPQKKKIRIDAEVINIQSLITQN